MSRNTIDKITDFFRNQCYGDKVSTILTDGLAIEDGVAYEADGLLLVAVKNSNKLGSCKKDRINKINHLLSTIHLSNGKCYSFRDLSEYNLQYTTQFLAKQAKKYDNRTLFTLQLECCYISGFWAIITTRLSEYKGA